MSNLHNKPLHNFYDVSPSEMAVYFDAIGGFSVSDVIELSDYRDDLVFFGIFPFDPVTNLFNFSATYMWKAVGEKGLNSFLKFFCETFNDVVGRTPSFVESELSSTVLPENTVPTYLLPFPISEKCLSESSIAKLSQNFIVCWKDICQLSEIKIFSKYGFLGDALFIQIELLQELVSEMQGGKSQKYIDYSRVRDGLSEFNHFLAAWLRKTVSGRNSERDATLLAYRFGWESGEPKTLEEVASLSGDMTRERVRQIESKWLDKVSNSNAVFGLGPIWSLLEAYVYQQGVTTIKEFHSKCLAEFGWSNTFTIKAFKNIMQLFPKNYYRNIAIEEDYILLDSLIKCLKCRVLINYIESHMSNRDYCDRNDINISAKNECSIKCDEYNSKEFNSCFWDLFFKNNFKKSGSIIFDSDKDGLFSKEYYQSQHGTLVASIEYFMLQAGEPLHFTEAYKAYKQIKPEHEMSKRLMHATLARTPNVVLWDRGTFIHTKIAPFPYDLLRKIEDNIFKKLNSGIPVISSHGPFLENEDLLLSEGIPNEIALYSCLRISNDPRIACPQQPYVVLRENANNFSSISVYLEEFIRDYGETVPPEAIKKFALGDLNLKDFQLHNFMMQIPAVYGTVASGCIHESNLNLDTALVDSLLNHTRRLLSKFDSVSLSKVYNDQAVLCRLLGINSPLMLGYIFEKMSSGEMEIHRNHHITKTKEGIDKSVPALILEYIKDKKAPCSYKELHEHFIENRGYGEASLNSVFYGSDVYRYVAGCVMDGSALGITEDLLSEVYLVLENEYRTKIKSGEVFGSIADVVENRSLPDLCRGFYWGETLLCDVVTKSKVFRNFGYNKIPYVSSDSDITSLDELISYVLEKKFDGHENLNKFTKYLSRIRVIDKTIPNSLLNNSKLLIVKNGEISVGGRNVKKS